MKIGFPNNPRKNILEEIEWIGKNGFDFVDLFLEEDEAVPERINPEEVKKLLQRYKLSVVGHTAWYLPIGSPMRAIRKAVIKEVERYLEVFNKVGVKFVTIHANWPRGMFSSKEGIEFQVDTLRELVRCAGNYDLSIMYEPMDTPEDTVKNVSVVLDKVPQLFLHIDIGHASLFGRKPEQFIRKFSHRLKHVHLHDNDKNRDLHLPLGCGSIKWENIIKILKKYYDGTITLEVFSRDREYALLSKRKLRKLLQD